MQKIALEEERLCIPVLVGTHSLEGVQAQLTVRK